MEARRHPSCLRFIFNYLMKRLRFKPEDFSTETVKPIPTELTVFPTSNNCSQELIVERGRPRPANPRHTAGTDISLHVQSIILP
jgi:hypothetical protein